MIYDVIYDVNEFQQIDSNTYSFSCTKSDKNLERTDNVSDEQQNIIWECVIELPDEIEIIKKEHKVTSGGIVNTTIPVFLIKYSEMNE